MKYLSEKLKKDATKALEGEQTEQLCLILKDMHKFDPLCSAIWLSNPNTQSYCYWKVRNKLIASLSGVLRANIIDLFGKYAEWTLVVPGDFMAGSPKGELGGGYGYYKATIPNYFLIKKSQVTQVEWTSIMGNNPSRRKGPEHPVERVSWHDALKYCNALSRSLNLYECYNMSKYHNPRNITIENTDDFNHEKLLIPSIVNLLGYRIPTEIEWEYAYRAGTNSSFYNGEITSTNRFDPTLDKIAWYQKNSKMRTHPVMKKDPNAWDLYDMTGNVWEWVWERWDDKSSFNYRIKRGGGYSSPSWRCRAGHRTRALASHRLKEVGFRPVRSIIRADET